MSHFKAISKYLLAIFMITAGIMHFVNPAFFLKIVPPYFSLDVCKSKSVSFGERNAAFIN